MSARSKCTGVRLLALEGSSEPFILLYKMIVTKSHELTQIYSTNNTMTKQRNLTEIKWINTNAINIKRQYKVSPPAIYTLLKDHIHYNVLNGYMFIQLMLKLHMLFWIYEYLFQKT